MDRPTRLKRIPRHRIAGWLLLLTGLCAANPSWAERDYEQEMTALSAKLSAEAAKRKLARVAVADLTDLEGAATPLGRFLAEDLSSALAERGIVAVVDRIRLGAALKAQGVPDIGRLGVFGLTQLGKRIGVDAVVTGTLTDMADGFRVTVKLLPVATGAVVAAAKTTLPRTGPLAQLRGPEPALPPPAPTPPAPLPKTQPRDTGLPAGMALVPAGSFIFGQAGAERKLFLPAFWIDFFEVTNADYAKVRGIEFTPAKANYPVADISWKDAMVYCEAAGKRLPTEEEWEKAARGTDGRRFPWGNDYDPAKVNAENRADGTMPVGRFRAGASPYGLFDMAGNVAEWTSSGDDQARIYKGGAWGSPPADLASGARDQLTTPFHVLYLGFRCAKDGS
jgi:formylglycine-generating enzyme required for sulfatase activity